MDTSPLARLPAELRNRIYGYAITPDDIDEDGTDEVKIDDLLKSNQLKNTCRQLRAETHKMMYIPKNLSVHLSTGEERASRKVEALGKEVVTQIDNPGHGVFMAARAQKSSVCRVYQDWGFEVKVHDVRGPYLGKIEFSILYWY